MADFAFPTPGNPPPRGLQFESAGDDGAPGDADRRRRGTSDATLSGTGNVLGIRDAASLAWKLVALLSGASIRSYEDGGRDHARIYIETTVSVGEMMNSAETAEARHAIAPRSARVCRSTVASSVPSGRQ